MKYNKKERKKKPCPKLEYSKQLSQGSNPDGSDCKAQTSQNKLP